MAGLLEAAKVIADAAFDRFVEAASAEGFPSQWVAYQNEDKWSADLLAAHSDYIGKLHAFYLLRDGPHGWLGGRERASTAKQGG